MFDGKSLDGWKSNEETPGVFTITEDGSLKVEGGRAHLFWVGHGDIPAEFKNFRFKMKIKTTAGSNSGIFFHAKWLDIGWPEAYEAQVNSTHKDKRKTGSIWNISDVYESPSVDGEWMDYEIQVRGKKVTILANDKVINEYTEPDDYVAPKGRPNVKISKGTFAIQGHDPKSITYYKDMAIQIRAKKKK